MNSEELQLLPLMTQNGSPIPIAYLFLQPEKGKPVFVWFCGFKSEMGSLKAKVLSTWSREHGAGCLRFDYSGHGKSGGRFEDGTISSWMDQAAAVCQAALPPGPVVFVGSSMGGWIALLLAQRLRLPAASGQPLKGIVLIAPAWDMTRLMWANASEEARAAVKSDGVYFRPSAYGDGPYAITKRLLEDGESHLFGKGPVELNGPVRILHGRQDPDVPWRHSLDLLDVLDCDDMRLTLIKDGEHRLSRPQDLAVLFSMLEEFL
jgi:pimeloyl-ACP methyl ester carboxylesterase